MKKSELLIFLIIGIIIVSIYPSWVVDDTAILFRYAENFRNHGELNWNIGEYFEGYTGIILLAILIVSPFEYLTTAHAIGVASYLISIIFIYLIIKEKYLRIFSMSFFILSPAILTHVYSGLETILFFALCLASFYFFKERKTNLLTMMLILLSLTRPEGIAISALLLFLYKEKKPILIVGASILMYLLWKFYYYGNILPNSFYHKYITENAFTNNWKDYKEFFLIYMLIPIGLIAYNFKKMKWLFVLALVLPTFYYLNCLLAQNYSYRFFVHPLPIVFILLAYCDDIKKDVMVGLIVVQGFLFLYALPKELLYIEEEQRIIKVLKDTGEFIKSNYPKETKLAVYADAGYIPFISGMHTIDIGGLLDKNLAHSELGKTDIKQVYLNKIDYLFNQNPDVIAVSSMDSVPVCFYYHRLLYSDPRIMNYQFVARVGCNLLENKGTPERPFDKYYQFVLEKRLPSPPLK